MNCLVEQIEKVVRECGEILLHADRTSSFVSSKEGHGNFVTVYDKKIQEKLQKDLAARENVVMDGRDIGTCVLPNAQCKVYLTASSIVRAKRRYDELAAKGVDCDIKEIEQDIIERDYRDMHRETSPLKQAEDAVLVDTSDMTIEQVIDRIVALIG